MPDANVAIGPDGLVERLPGWQVGVIARLGVGLQGFEVAPVLYDHDVRKVEVGTGVQEP